MRVSFNFQFFALLLGALLAGRLAGAQSAPTYQWATGLEAFGQDNLGISTAISPNGDVYSTYEYTSRVPITIGTLTFPGTTTNNCLLLRHDATGQVTGSLLLGVRASVYKVITDSSGNVYAVGRFGDRVTAGSLTLTTSGGYGSYFVGKWNAAGVVQWLQQGELQGSWGGLEYTHLLAVDAAGRVTMAGATMRPIRFGSTIVAPLASRSNQSTFCVQLDGATGSFRWAGVGTSLIPHCYFTDLAAEPATGDLVLVGDCTPGNFQWEGRSIGTAAARCFWLRLSAGGAFRAAFASELNPHNVNGITPPSAGPHVAAAGNGYSFVEITGITPGAGPRPSLNGAPVPGANPNEYTVLALLDPAGTPQWVRVLQDSSFYRFMSVKALTTSLTTARSGGLATCYLGGSYRSPGTYVLAPTAQLPPTNNRAIGFVAALDGATGAPQWAVPAATGLESSAVKSLHVDAGGRFALSGFIAGDSSRFGSLLVRFPPSFNSNAYTAKLLQSYNQIQGAAFADRNANGLFDPTDHAFSGLVVECQPDGTSFTTESTGDYSAITELGQRTVTLAPPLHYTLPNLPAPATFATFGNIAAGRDFALQPIANQPDVQVFVTPVSRARPGFALRYQVRYRNVGTTTLSGTVAVQLDPRLTYLGLLGATGTVSGGVLTVPYTGLAPFGEGTFNVQFQVPTTVAAGTVLLTTATVEPVNTDTTPADNTETNRLTVTASYDPNDIAVNWPRLTPTQVAGGEWLEYTIRFENLGTDTAFSILLRDSLPAARLNLGTLRLVTASHSCTYRLVAGGLLTVQFTNIQLPYRNINALGAMGFVRFRVRPRGSLVPGDVVPNRADIHFDFNAPIVTNTALTTVQRPAGLGVADGAADAVSLWPNPATGTLYIEQAVAGPLNLTLLDNVGRAVRTYAVPDARRAAALDVRHLPAGLYLLRSATWTRRVVVR